MELWIKILILVLSLGLGVLMGYLRSKSNNVPIETICEELYDILLTKGLEIFKEYSDDGKLSEDEIDNLIKKELKSIFKITISNSNISEKEKEIIINSMLDGILDKILKYVHEHFATDEYLTTMVRESHKDTDENKNDV